MSCKTIDEVLLELDRIVEESVGINSYLGIFAYVYRRTTAQIKAGVEKKIFDDNDRMEQMDVVFANLYIESYRTYFMNKPVHDCWKSAFEERFGQITILQHILLGMNAHINLDLGLAAAVIMQDKPIKLLENDFMKVNEILASLVDELQLKLGRVSRLMFLLDLAGGRKDELLINFSMEKARDQSWRTANEIWQLNGDARNGKIKEIDSVVNFLATQIKTPAPKVFRYIIRLIKIFEEKNVKRILDGFEAP